MNELVKFNPAELVVNAEMFASASEINEINLKMKTYITMNSKETEDLNISGYEKLEKMPYAREASKMLFSYIRETQKIDMKHISSIEYYSTSKYMVLSGTGVLCLGLWISSIIRKHKKKKCLMVKLLKPMILN